MRYYPEFHIKNITPEWQPLVEKYPEIFLDLSPMVKSLFIPPRDKEVFDLYYPNGIYDLCNLRYGVECHIKWLPFIDKFCEEVTELSKCAKSNGHDAYYKSFILKEKYGTLRDQGDWLGNDCDLYRPQYLKSLNTLESATI